MMFLILILPSQFSKQILFTENWEIIQLSKNELNENPRSYKGSLFHLFTSVTHFYMWGVYAILNTNEGPFLLVETHF